MAFMHCRRTRVKSNSTLPLFDWAAHRSIIANTPQATILERRLMKGRGCSHALARAVIAAWDMGGRDNG